MLIVETFSILSLKSGNRKVASHLYKNSNTKITISHKKKNYRGQKSDMVAHPLNPSTPETKAGESL